MNAAFAGFRHGHVKELWKMARANPDICVLGGWEENEEARKAAQAWGVEFSYRRLEDLLRDERVDLVILGDCYGKRGIQAIEALKAGKHVLADKPLCTRIAELEEIRRLSREKKRCVSCMLPLRYAGYARSVKRIIDGGEWGRVRCGLLTGQHPLMYGSRPGWYFEQGMHGGTITDIAVHGVDLIRYLTGQEMERVEFARTWNAFAKHAPRFRDCGQFAYRLADGAGIMGDVSYASPDSFGYSLDSYWKVQLWLDGGKIEFGENLKEIRLYKNGETECRCLPVEGRQEDCLADLIREIRGGESYVQNTRDVLAAMETVLQIQAAAGEE